MWRMGPRQTSGRAVASSADYFTRTNRTDSQTASDFDRFKLHLAKRSRRDLVRKAYVKEKKASA